MYVYGDVFEMTWISNQAKWFIWAQLKNQQCVSIMDEKWPMLDFLRDYPTLNLLKGFSWVNLNM